MTGNAPRDPAALVTPPAAPVVEVRGVTFRYPGRREPALHAVHLHAMRGRILGLLGPNGSGKTTMLSLLMGLLAPDEGEVRVAGHRLPDGRRLVQRLAAFVPQANAFYPSLTVRENLDVFAALRGLRGAAQRDRLDAVVATTALAAVLPVRAAQLSGGMQRRLSLAIGLLAQPTLLLLDEPTVGVDPEARAFLLDAVRAAGRAGTSIIYCSHHLEEIEAVCDDVAILAAGRVRVQDTLAGLLAAARTSRLRVDLAVSPTPAQADRLAKAIGGRLEGRQLQVPDCRSDDLPAHLAAIRAVGVDVAEVRYGDTGLPQVYRDVVRRAAGDA